MIFRRDEDEADPIEATAPTDVAAQRRTRDEGGGMAEDNGEVTIVGTGARLEGNVVSAGNLRIDGQVKGQISMVQGTLLVAPTARIEADIDVTNVTIHGTMAGKVAAGERVELTPTATVKGTLVAPSVVLREGATFNGKIQVEKKGTAKAAASKPN